jgi:hypothetical protein
MTDPHASDRDVSRAIRSWLHEDRHEDASRVAGAVLDQVVATPQRRAMWWRARRMPFMNKFVSLGLGAAAVVVALIIGTQVLGPPAPGGVGAPASPSPSPTLAPAAVTTPSPTPAGGLPDGPFLITGDDGPIDGGPVQISVAIASPGWFPYPEVDGVTKGPDDGQDPPEGAGAMLLAWTWPVGTGFNVYGDPCNWITTIPETPATAPDEIAADLAAQASRDSTAPVDVTVGGYAGKAITLRTPMSFYIDEDASREEEFADCDQDAFVMYGIEGNDTEAIRNAQGPGQIDELWILDVNGAIVILDASYSPATPAALIEELRALAESATFDEVDAGSAR